MRGVMIQGTSSDSGKSFLVTGLCRLLSDRGLRVCPFKSQNMSNNAYVTWDEREMSRAQAVQAEAARLRPEVFMNPILLKPRQDTVSEIILEGRALEAPAEKGNYRAFAQGPGIKAIRRALRYIGRHFDAVVIEGAGSPAEVNLNDSEIVNMRVAREADVPVLLATDVDRGGSLASIVGTLELLGEDRKRVKGLIFNKFRGDLALFLPAVRWIEDYTKIPVLGVVPWVGGVSLPGEDSLSLRWGTRPKDGLKIGILRFPSVSNFTDLDPLNAEPDVSLISIEGGGVDLGALDAIVLPGSKNTMRDMAWLLRTGLAEAIRAASRAGRFVLGLCGGYQMMGQWLLDPGHKENAEFTRLEGLGLLPAATEFTARTKRTANAAGVVRPEFSPEKLPVFGYEIHWGRTKRLPGAEDVLPLFDLNGRDEGLARPGLSLLGTYLHGVLECDGFRTLWLNALRRSRGLEERGVTDTRGARENAYQILAHTLERHLDLEAILALAG